MQIIVSQYLGLGQLTEHARILDLSLDFILVNLNMGHVDYHDVIKHVNITKVTLQHV